MYVARPIIWRSLLGFWKSRRYFLYQDESSLFDIEAVKTLIALSQDRFSPEIHRPITHFVPSNLAFEQQLELPKQCNSPFINFIYLEGAPEEELGKLATASMLACANVDVSRLGLPYKTTPIQGIAYRRGENYRYRESDLLVRAGSSWLEENNAGELLLGDVCSTYREKMALLMRLGSLVRPSLIINLRSLIWPIS